MSRTKRVLMWIMAAAFVFAGVTHFTQAAEFVKMMPPYLPLHWEAVYLSGVAEIVLGLGLLVPQTRKYAAWGLILLLIAVFPANIHIALNDIPLFGAEKGAGALNWVRLPFQALFIVWAWWYTRD
jgi:uncharacterized membrane protein